MLLRVVEELLAAEALVLRERQVLNVLATQQLLAAADDVAHPVDRNAFVRRQVTKAFDREKVIPIHSEVSGFRGTYTSLLALNLAAKVRAFRLEVSLSMCYRFRAVTFLRKSLILIRRVKF